MKTTTKETVQQEIKRRNEVFKKASKEEKRVLIAEDVLALIKSKKITPTVGMWVDFYTKNDVFDLYDKSFREAMFDGEIETCECCALGSIMTSCTLFKNKVSVGDAYEHEALQFDAISDGYVNDKIGLMKLFSRKQLALIEIAFEEGTGYHDVDCILDNIEDGTYQDHLKEAIALLREATKCSNITIDEVRKALNFGHRYKDDEKRLVAIMENIIKNNGTFIP